MIMKLPKEVILDTNIPIISNKNVADVSDDELQQPFVRKYHPSHHQKNLWANFEYFQTNQCLNFQEIQDALSYLQNMQKFYHSIHRKHLLLFAASTFAKNAAFMNILSPCSESIGSTCPTIS